MSDGYIRIFGDYYTSADTYQWILFKKVTRTSRGEGGNGEQYEDYETCGFYPSLGLLCASAMRKLARDGVASGELKSLREIVQRSQQIEEAIRGAIREDL